MMASDSNGQRLYQLEFSQAIIEDLRQRQRKASREGRGEQFLSAVREAIKRLQSDPRSFGEPLYRLPALRLQVRSAVIRTFGVHFAVSDDRPLVFIRFVKLLSSRKA